MGPNWHQQGHNSVSGFPQTPPPPAASPQVSLRGDWVISSPARERYMFSVNNVSRVFGGTHPSNSSEPLTLILGWVHNSEELHVSYWHLHPHFFQWSEVRWSLEHRIGKSTALPWVSALASLQQVAIVSFITAASSDCYSVFLCNCCDFDR